MGLIFGPKLLFIYQNPELTKEEQNNQFQESTASQAEQLLYQQHLKENAELKKQINAVRLTGIFVHIKNCFIFALFLEEYQNPGMSPYSGKSFAFGQFQEQIAYI